MQSPNKFEEAFQIVGIENETPIFVQECRVNYNSFFNKKRLIILTERSLFYFSRRMHGQKFNLFKINSFFIDKNAVTLGFDSDSNIKIALSKNYRDSKENLVDSLFFVIQHLLTNSEIERIKFNNTNSVSKLISIPSYYGAFCHFESSLRDEFFNFYTQSNDILDQIRFRFSILFHRKLIKLCSYRNQEYSSKHLLETLPLLPSARYLSIKQFRNINIYSLLNNYIKNLNELKHISIDGSVDYQNDTISFNNFINLMKTNLNSKMVGLSFLNSNFKENHLTIINEYVSSNKIKALEFHKTFSNETVINFFITTFMTSLSESPDFTSLNIEEIKINDFDKFLQNLPSQIQSLSIVNCEGKIDQILRTIKMDSKFSNNLNVLNLSYNTFEESIKTFEIPSFLTVINLDYVTFPKGILAPFLNSLFRSIKNDSEISLVQMKASDDDFEKLEKMFYNLVSDCKNKKENLKYIRSLNWNFNPISTFFISFLKLQTRLKNLSVSGCFCPKDSKGFDDFCFYLASNDSLEKLTCRGFNKLRLESMTPRLLSAVSFSKISFLDISNSRGGTQCYEYLKSIIKIDDNLSTNKKIDEKLSNDIIKNFGDQFMNKISNVEIDKNDKKKETDDNISSNEINNNKETDKNLNSNEIINNKETDDNISSNEIISNKETDDSISSNEIINDIETEENLNSNEIINNIENIGTNKKINTVIRTNKRINDENDMNLNNQVGMQIDPIIKPSASNLPIIRNSLQISHENFRSSQNLNFSKASNLKCVIYDGLLPFNKVKLMEFVEFTSKNCHSCQFSFPIHDIECLFKKQKISFDDIAQMISQSQIKTQNDYIKPFTVFYKENRNSFPFYFKNKNEDEVENENHLEQQQISLIDNDVKESLIKPGSFFGLYHEIFDISNIPEKDPFIFSFHSENDDDDDEFIDKKNSINKYPNSKKSEIVYSKSDEKEKPAKSPIIDAETEDEYDESSSFLIQNKNSSKIDSDSDYSYDYSQEEKPKIIIKPIQNKTIPLNRRVPLIRPIFQRKIIFNKTVNNVKKKPVLQLNFDDSSDYDYSYYSYED